MVPRISDRLDGSISGGSANLRMVIFWAISGKDRSLRYRIAAVVIGIVKKLAKIQNIGNKILYSVR